MAQTANARTATVAANSKSVTFVDSNDWGQGFVADVTLANTGAAAIPGWTLDFDLASSITSIWNASIVSHVGMHYQIRGLDYDSTLPSGTPVSFGFQADGGNPVLPTQAVLNGEVLTSSAAPTPTPTPNPTPTPTPTPSASPAPNPPAGSHLLPEGFLDTAGNQIVDASGHAVKITAVNWYGMETSSFAPQGLDVRSYRSMMDQMVSLGFNAIRLPFSLQFLASSSAPSGINYTFNPDLAGLTGLQVLDKIVAYAGTIGLKIVLDDHRSAAGSGPNDDGLWYDSGYTEAQWIAGWTGLASRYANNPTIIAADLSNEPHGAATWGDGSATDWAAAATRAGNAIQAVNPNWLIMVEGVQNYNGQSTWWGGNLQGVLAHPIQLSVANKVVYSTHDYPASVYPQSWFSAANYPNNLGAFWDANWGYIYKDGIAPIFVGEYGSKLQSSSDTAWMSKLVAYMAAPVGGANAQGISWGYWDWNPTSGDTGGILNSDWTTVDQAKINAIAPGFYTSANTPANFVFVDAVTGASASDTGSAYAGPVTGLAYQYFWAGTNGAAIQANVANVFLKGGPGDDALAVRIGSNVLDGGSGSNFLVGGTGTDGGADTFFVDARGGAVTWSTVVNFHPGDQATIFGFRAGVSSRPLTPSDGAAGYQGVTLHSELGGPGTGVTASFTFSGIDAATASTHFAFTTGTLSGDIPYLLIQYLA